ncbi:GntR family transcriptional regulator [Kaistia sp. 32K]|uniref:GntR family transcriptional regulator n=1 Tax=Kaistia sp. 32K TaxID=2795690 RepID=UPI001915E057|nr:GntR family transcriptional regulator [Kaistia sp. 32K]BCP53298.1 GntR family transcriptional regulator [Kaistia sp. 32K]
MTGALLELVQSAAPRYRTATEYVEATLREAILSGTIAPGTPLRQEELAATFKVSRMPIREALRQLEAQALVDFEPHRGAVVVQITLLDAMDNYAIRAALEPQALRLSIPHLTEEDFDLAEDLLVEIDQETDPGRMGELNRRFHMTLYSQAGLPRLIALTEQHLATADRYLRFHLAAVGDMGQDEHREMLAACRARDEARAIDTLARHHGRASDSMEAFFRSRGGGKAEGRP